ncbi:MAG: zinc ribbon domain-containing protein [Actinomycetia bacterium]|nr:zinc ribbon domain-containing protein [Actinomycetes bacterium]
MMVTVCTCGYEAPSDARFCGGCGRAVDSADVPLLDLRGPEAASEQRVVKVNPGPRRWMAIVGIVCAGLIGWSAWGLATGSNGETGSASPEAAAAEDAGGPEGDDPDGDDGPETEDEAAAATETSRTTSTTTERTTTSEPSQVETVAASAPILGEEVGYHLIVGTIDRPAILDLNSGQIRYAEGSRADPLAVTGNWLIAGRSDRPFILDLTDLEADPLQFPFPNSSWFEIPDRRQRDDGRVWVRISDMGLSTPSIVLVDAATGEIVDERETPDGASFNYFSRTLSQEGPLLVSASAGGVYEERGGGFNRVADGYVIVADERRALVETCDGELRCASHWLDRQTWRLIDLVAPEGQDSFTSFVNGTDWLLAIEFNSNGPIAHIFNVVTGQKVDLSYSENELFGYYELSPAISPDGRWLATASAGEVQFVELETGREIRVEGVRDVVGPVIFFEPSS